MSEDSSTEQVFDIPQEIALLPLLNFLVYPQMVSPLAVGQAASVRLIDDAMAGDQLVALVALRGDQQRLQPRTEDVFDIGTVALAHRLLRLPDGTLRVAIQGIERIRIEEIIQSEPYLRARISLYPDVTGEPVQAQSLANELKQLVAQLLCFLPAPGDELATQIADESDPQRLAYLVASSLLFRSEIAERQRILEAPTVADRLGDLRAVLQRELAVLQARSGPATAAQSSLMAAVQPTPSIIRRVVANIPTNDVAQSQQFYRQLGFTTAMDLGWITTMATATDSTMQVSLLVSDPSGIYPNLSIEVDDVDAVYAAAVAQNQPIVYPLTNEPWGVRRFFLRDPNGVIVNILSHG